MWAERSRPPVRRTVPPHNTPTHRGPGWFSYRPGLVLFSHPLVRWPCVRMLSIQAQAAPGYTGPTGRYCPAVSIWYSGRGFLVPFWYKETAFLSALVHFGTTSEHFRAASLVHSGTVILHIAMRGNVLNAGNGLLLQANETALLYRLLLRAIMVTGKSLIRFPVSLCKDGVS